MYLRSTAVKLDERRGPGGDQGDGKDRLDIVEWMVTDDPII